MKLRCFFATVLVVFGAKVPGRYGCAFRHFWCYHCCFAGAAAFAPAFDTALLLRLPICLYLLLCCCFFAALLLLRCLSPGLPEIEENTTSPPNPPDRPASNRPVLDSPWTALPWTSLRQNTPHVVVFCSLGAAEQNRFCSSLLVPFTFLHSPFWS